MLDLLALDHRYLIICDALPNHAKQPIPVEDAETRSFLREGGDRDHNEDSGPDQASFSTFQICLRNINNALHTLWHTNYKAPMHLPRIRTESLTKSSLHKTGILNGPRFARENVHVSEICEISEICKYVFVCIYM